MSLLTDLNPQALAVKALIGVAAIGATFAGGAYMGYKHEKLIYDNFVLAQKDAAQQQVIANKDALAKQQAAYDDQVQKIHSEYTDNAQHLQASRDAALADSVASSDRLRQYLASSHARPVVSGSQSATVGTATGGQGSTRLLDGVSSLNWYLTQRFSDADSVAVKLNEAIDLIAEDRKVCNGVLPGANNQ